MGRLFLVTPHYCIPIRSGDHEVLQQPPPTQPNPATWRLFKTFARCFTATASIGLVVFAFVGRHFNLYPELQDPSTVVLIMFMALIQVGYGFMTTQGDVQDTNSETAPGEQHL